MTALALRQQESKWTIMNGPQKGSVQVTARPLIVIGRSNECDIVIAEDPKCSRRHAQVQCTTNGFQIERLSDNNELWVNGKSLETALLKNGDVITIGTTEILFNVTESPKATSPSIRREPSIRVVPSQPQAQVGAAPPAPPADPTSFARPISHRPPKQKSNVKGLVIAVGVIGIFFLWLLTGNGAKKRKELELRTEEQQMAQDMETAKGLTEAAEKQRMQRNLGNSYEINHAQENYVKGFRDYEKGRYESAKESFQACLALNPDHILCNRYLRLADRKYNELIEYHMVLGRQYRDQNQYYACRTAFQNAAFMVKDHSDARYKEAIANFDACNRMIEGRY